MSITLNTTLADKYANSYATAAYCDDFWSNHYNTAKAIQWAALTDGQKTTLLIKSCRVVETARFTLFSNLAQWIPLYYDRRTGIVAQLNTQVDPVRYYYYQALQFPRNLDRDINTGDLFIPEPVLMAQCEQTVYSLNFDDTAVANRMQGIVTDHTYVGNIKLAQAYVGNGSEWSPQALEYIRPLLLKTSSRVRRS